MDRRQQAQGGARRLEMLRQKRNLLRTRSEEVSSWVGHTGGAPASSAGGVAGGRQLSDAATLAAAQRRRAAAAYALSSSSSSSDSEEAGDGERAAGVGPAPTEQEVTAKLFAKLGIKHGGHKGAHGGGFDSDSSWASSPERSRLIKASGGGSMGAAAGQNGSTGAAGEQAQAQAQAELERARSTIAALQEELAAARAQADNTTQQLHGVQEYAQVLEDRLHATEQELAALRVEAGGAAAAGQPADGQATNYAGHHELGVAATSTAGASSADDMEQLAAAHCQLEEEVQALSSQLAAAAVWQQDVHSMQAELAGMQAAVAESEAARQQAEAELGGLLRQREAELMEATARLAAVEAQLAALQGVAGPGGVGIGGVQLRPAVDLLAEFAISHAQITAALAEAAALLA